MKKILNFKIVKKRFSSSSGFSLMELLVVISIFIVLTSVVLFKYAQFNSNLLITNTAYEIAILLREAQVYGISAKETGTGNFSAGFGVNFDKLTPTSFTFFTDTDTTSGVGKYDAGLDVKLDTFTLRQGNTIANVCGEYTVGATILTRCFNGGAPADIVDITFLRPNPRANIKVYNNGNPVGPANYNRVIVDVVSPKGKHKNVIIAQTGQISVQ